MNIDILLDMNNDGDNASETDSLLGAKKRHRVKNSWFDEEADEQADDDDENTTGGFPLNRMYSALSCRSTLIIM